MVASLQAGIEAKGATIDDFRDPDGARGSFQDQFLVHLREGEPCPRCGRAVRKLRAAGRGHVRLRGLPAAAAGARYAAAASSSSRPARSARTSS